MKLPEKSPLYWSTSVNPKPRIATIAAEMIRFTRKPAAWSESDPV